jgi:hypothetical protein
MKSVTAYVQRKHTSTCRICRRPWFILPLFNDHVSVVGYMLRVLFGRNPPHGRLLGTVCIRMQRPRGTEILVNGPRFFAGVCLYVSLLCVYLYL